ncbi:MAG: hypothetical protein IPK12_24380 [Gemmatimonadetes bacterium]|nr:hypothetical protein [Gemmatimonadota bacterium]
MPTARATIHRRPRRLDATGADSLFLAHYCLSVAAGWLAGRDALRRLAERAWAPADRLTSHDRALVEAHPAYIRGPNDAVSAATAS